MNYFCCDDKRRAALKGHPLLNGIDFLEVVDIKGDPDEIRQTVLIVRFINALVPGSLQIDNIVIEGGERISNVKVISLDFGPGSPPFSPVGSPPDDESGKILLVKLNKAGDFSQYTLKLVQDSSLENPPAGFDPILSSVKFSFKVLCPNDFDCKTTHTCVTEDEKPPDINYLAKDYASFRQLMLDRMALLVHQWRDRNPADFGIVLIELLAYTSDYLSYRQDAIATEAYLGTARKRASVRRHARLVDYFMHDGCNARTWVHIKVAGGIQNLELKKETAGEKTKILTRRTDLPLVFKSDNTAFERIIGKKKSPLVNPGPTNKEFDFILPHDLQIFELLHDIILDNRHNEMNFYTWLDDECCLPEGATSATLDGHFPALKTGDVLIFAEVAGPITGNKSDADPLHRHAVQLTKVALSDDPLGNHPVTNITWHKRDALPFPLCISSTPADGKTIMVSVAYGNNVLVDHGFTIYEKLPPVPATNIGSPGLSIIQSSGCFCEKPKANPVPARYRPFVKKIPLTLSAPYDHTASVSASSSRSWSMRDPLPAIVLQQDGVEGDWSPQRDLLASKHNAEHFVVEVESDGIATLRFGNGVEGEKPEPAAEFMAVYRIGNGISGNVGAGTLNHLVSDAPEITSDKIIEIWNPLPAIGGKEQEDIETVRMRAPIAFRSRQERAVTLADYEEVSKRCDTGIQRSAASLRWTGSWRTVFITVDKIGGKKTGEKFEKKLRNCIEKYRMAGHDLEVDDPKFISLEITMTVCVEANYFKSDVESALVDKFSNRLLANGKRGVFHPDNFTFGQPVYMSPVYTAAQETEGVKSVTITKFQRQGKDDAKAMQDGVLLLGRFEIARLDNDPNFPEHGVFKLDMQGGK